MSAWQATPSRRRTAPTGPAMSPSVWRRSVWARTTAPAASSHTSVPTPSLYCCKVNTISVHRHYERARRYPHRRALPLQPQRLDHRPGGQTEKACVCVLGRSHWSAWWTSPLWWWISPTRLQRTVQLSWRPRTWRGGSGRLYCVLDSLQVGLPARAAAARLPGPAPVRLGQPLPGPGPRLLPRHRQGRTPNTG